MERLVIGIPARNEGATIADLAAALEQGAAMLGEGIRCEPSSPINPVTTTPWPDGRATLSAFRTGCCKGLTTMRARVATSNGSFAMPTITGPTCCWWTAI